MKKKIELNHFLYHPIPEVGYPKNEPAASSPGFNSHRYTRIFFDEFELLNYSKEDDEYEGLTVINKSGLDDILFQFHFNTLDEMEPPRPCRANHTVIIPKKLLEEQLLALSTILERMKEFRDERDRLISGKIEPLEVPIIEQSNLKQDNRLRNYVSRPCVEDLASILIRSNNPKVHLTSERYSDEFSNVNYQDRVKMAVDLVELLDFEFGLGPLSVATDYLRPSSRRNITYYDLFDIIIGYKKKIPTGKDKEEWIKMSWSRPQNLVKKVEDNQQIYNNIERLFRDPIPEPPSDEPITKPPEDKPISDPPSDEPVTKPPDDEPISEPPSDEPVTKSPEDESGIQIPDDELEEANDKTKAQALLREAKREYGSINFDDLEDYIDSSNFYIEVFKTKLNNLKKKGEEITKQKREEKSLERLEKAKEEERILHEDYLDIKKSIEEKEDLSLFEEKFEKAKKRKKLHLLVEEICKGFEIPKDIREKVVRQGKKNIEVPSRKLNSDEIREELEEIKDKIESYYESLDKDEEKDKINNVEDLVLNHCPVDFGDVAGMSSLKQRLSGAVVSPIEDYDVIKEITGYPPENSRILLYGAPGVGKTFMARAVAGEHQLEYGLDVIDVPMEAIYGLHWSKQVERIVDIFQLSKEKSPSIVIWDEFDSYAADPKLTGRKYDEKKTTTFKQQFEGVSEEMSPKNGGPENMVLHVATSNYPWKLELPLIRPGRLGEIIFVPPPDKRAREEILKLLTSEAKIEGGIDFEKLAEETKDATIANLKNIVKEATQRPVREWRAKGRKGKPRFCTMEDFMWAVEKENLSQYESWVKEAKRELERPKLQSKADLFPEILKEYNRLVD